MHEACRGIQRGRGEAMTRLVDALTMLGLTGEITNAGRWARLDGERGPVYVVEASWDRGYFTWCDIPEGRVVEFYRDPAEAIRAGLGRAARPAPGG
jgi:hypothetical protein